MKCMLGPNIVLLHTQHLIILAAKELRGPLDAINSRRWIALMSTRIRLLNAGLFAVSGLCMKLSDKLMLFTSYEIMSSIHLLLLE